jgi:hypothetical protein
MNCQMYDTAIGLRTTGAKSSARSRCRLLSARFNASANSRPIAFEPITKPTARNRVFSNAV